MIIMIFILIAWVLIALDSAREEAAFTWPFREIGEPAFNTVRKSALQRTFHRYGASQIVTIAIMTGFLFCYVVQAKGYAKWVVYASPVYVTIFCLLIYWCVFDPLYNTAANLDRWYLGNTSRMDRRLRKLGPHAGRTKAYICAGVIIGQLIGAYLMFGYSI